MQGPRKRMTLRLSKAFQTQAISPPTKEDMLRSLRTIPQKRSPDDVTTIFRFLLLNEKLVRMLENPGRVKQVANQATLVTMHKGEVLFFEGDDPDSLYVVLNGTLDVIIRHFLVAEEFMFNKPSREDEKYKPLMEQMGLDLSIDRLRKVNVLRPGDVFGQHSYLLDRQRLSTIMASSEVVDLVKFDGAIFQQTSALILAKAIFSENKEFCQRVFPRLREDQLTMISALADVIALKPGAVISTETSLGRFLYIVKSGMMSRFRVVDFSDLSFRKIDAPFSALELRFPDGMHAVHTDDLGVRALFADPSLIEMSDTKFHVKSTTHSELIALDLDYFRIVVGAAEVERVRQQIRSRLSDHEIVKLWVEAERGRLWNKFREKERKESHKQLKGERQFHSSLVAIRVPAVPKSIKNYKPRKVIPYAPKSLR